MKLKINKPSKKQVIVFASSLAFVLLMTGFYIVFDKTVKFFRVNTVIGYAPIKVQFHKPFEIKSLVQLEQEKVQDEILEEIAEEAYQMYINPTASKNCEVKVNIDPQVFFNTLRMKESTNGTNTNPQALHNYCKSKGKWNEIGYNPQAKFCFKDQEEAQLFVAYYVKKNCDGKTQAQCECFWNTGDMTDSCHYSKGELSQAN